MIADYPELLSGFVVLMGAGYPVRQAWKNRWWMEPERCSRISIRYTGDADDLESDGDRNARDPRLRGVWAADRNRRLYEICVASWKQREYGERI